MAHAESTETVFFFFFTYFCHPGCRFLSQKMVGSIDTYLSICSEKLKPRQPHLIFFFCLSFRPKEVTTRSPSVSSFVRCVVQLSIRFFLERIVRLCLASISFRVVPGWCDIVYRRMHAYVSEKCERLCRRGRVDVSACVAGGGRTLTLRHNHPWSWHKLSIRPRPTIHG